MNNPDTSRDASEPIGGLPISHAPIVAGRDSFSEPQEYSDSTDEIPQANGNRLKRDASLSLEVASARFGASAFACGMLPFFLWSSGSLGTTAALVFAAVSAVGCVRFLLADPCLRTAGFVGFQMFVAAVAVGLEFGLFAGATFGFLLLPSGVLASATLFGRFRQEESATVQPIPEPVQQQMAHSGVTASATGSRRRPSLRVVSGRSRAQSA